MGQRKLLAEVVHPSHSSVVGNALACKEFVEVHTATERTGVVMVVVAEETTLLVVERKDLGDTAEEGMAAVVVVAEVDTVEEDKAEVVVVVAVVGRKDLGSIAEVDTVGESKAFEVVVAVANVVVVPQRVQICCRPSRQTSIYLISSYRGWCLLHKS